MIKECYGLFPNPRLPRKAGENPKYVNRIYTRQLKQIYKKYLLIKLIH